MSDELVLTDLEAKIDTLKAKMVDYLNSLSLSSISPTMAVRILELDFSKRAARPSSQEVIPTNTDPMAMFFYDALCNRRLCGVDWGDAGMKVEVRAVYDSFVIFCKAKGVRVNTIPTINYFGRNIGTYTGATRGQRTVGARSWCYSFPSLDDSREQFQSVTNCPNTWGNNE